MKTKDKPDISREKMFYLVLNSFAKIEKKINIIIAHYFSLEEKIPLFEKEILSNISFAKKLDMLKNINIKEDYFDKKVIEKIKQCSIIRNSLAHNNPDKNFKYSINLNGKQIIADISFFFEEYKASFEFSSSELDKIVEHYTKLEELKEIIKNLAYFHVHVRNYKDWFVDIYDVEIEDEDGNEISVDYPEYQFSTENYEEEVIAAVKSYLNDKYNANTDNIDGEVILDWFESVSED